jgi:hypothetical protein
MKPLAIRPLLVLLCLAASAAALIAASHRAAAADSVTIGSGWNSTRTTIPVTVGYERANCVLDTGTSAIIVSPSLARSAGLNGRAGTFELAPDGRTHVDRQTQIPHFSVGGRSLHDVPALISSNLNGSDALCGYDFFAHFPTLIDRDRRQVTLFPSASRVARLHCVQVDLAPRVPLATIQINDTWVSHIVLDSGMAGGGALWDGIRGELHRPLVANADYETMPSAVRDGFACGALASIRYAPSSAESDMPICTEPQRPDGYNGIIETNLTSVHAMFVDYPHHHVCFDVGSYAAVAMPNAPAPTPSGVGGDAWSRFNALRPPE